MTKPSLQTEEFATLITEQRNPRSMDMDQLETDSILRLINSEDKIIPAAVEKEIPYIAEAVEIIVDSLKAGGRLFYFGAGTSGRLGVLDAAECPPTFGTEPSLVRGIIAGGDVAMFRAQEGAEDRKELALQDIALMEIDSKDVVCGIAASRRTPYVVGAIEEARRRRAKTIYVTTNPRSEFNLDVDVAICPEVGPEVLMGSTRMKSGTAQKLVLNMLTTASMIKLGKVYQNMMVDLKLTNQKLTERAKRIIMIATEISYEEASSLLNQSDGHVKTAIVMAVKRISKEEAKKRLADSGGFIRAAIEPANE